MVRLNHKFGSHLMDIFDFDGYPYLDKFCHLSCFLVLTCKKRLYRNFLFCLFSLTIEICNADLPFLTSKISQKSVVYSFYRQVFSQETGKSAYLIRLTGFQSGCIMKTTEDPENRNQVVKIVRILTNFAITIFNQLYEKSCEIKRRSWCEIFQRFAFYYT